MRDRSPSSSDLARYEEFQLEESKSETRTGRHIVLFRGIPFLLKHLSEIDISRLITHNLPTSALMTDAARQLLTQDPSIQDPIQAVQENFARYPEDEKREILNLYVKDLDSYKHRQRSLHKSNPEKAPTPEKELLSFTLSAHSACQYGTGLLDSCKSSEKKLVGYDVDGYPAENICAGIIVAAAIPCEQWNESTHFHVRKFISENDLSLNFRQEQGDEVIISGGVPQEFMLFQMPLLMPDFSCRWNPSFEERFGFNRRDYEDYAERFRDLRNLSGDISDKLAQLEERILNRMARFYEKKLEAITDRFVEEPSRRYPSLPALHLKKFLRKAEPIEAARAVRQQTQGAHEKTMDVDMSLCDDMLRQLLDAADEIATCFNQEAFSQVINKVENLVNESLCDRIFQLSMDTSIEKSTTIARCFEQYRIILNYAAESMHQLIVRKQDNAVDNPQIGHIWNFHLLTCYVSNYINIKKVIDRWIVKLHETHTNDVNILQIARECRMTALELESEKDIENIKYLLKDVLHYAIFNYLCNLQNDKAYASQFENRPDEQKLLLATIATAFSRICEYYLGSNDSKLLAALEKTADEIVGWLDLQDNTKNQPFLETILRRSIIDVYLRQLRDLNKNPLFAPSRKIDLQMALIGQYSEMIRVGKVSNDPAIAQENIDAENDLYLTLNSLELSGDKREALERIHQEAEHYQSDAIMDVDETPTVQLS